MTRKINSFAEGEYYHIYNRGIEKRDIFLDQSDFNRFIVLLRIANSKEPVHIQKTRKKGQGLTLTNDKEKILEIGSYCLMSNHFHLLIKETTEGGISKFMSKIMTAYTMYFNKRYERSGALFQGTFKAEHANSDEYLKYLFSYIHLNPVKLINPDWKEKGIENKDEVISFLKDYKYSSYLDYIGVNREENKIINKEVFPEYFLSTNDFEREIFDWLNIVKVKP
jgi:putative transposase